MVPRFFGTRALVAYETDHRPRTHRSSAGAFEVADALNKSLPVKGAQFLLARSGLLKVKSTGRDVSGFLGNPLDEPTSVQVTVGSEAKTFDMPAPG